MPVGYTPGKQYPLITWVYGGARRAGYANHFGLYPIDYHMQLFATRGYAVFVPDAPQQARTPMLDLAKAVLPGVNRVVELGIADENRLGVAGYSYGGYSALGLLVHTTRFRAAVAIAGFSSLFTEYGQLSTNGVSRGPGWAEGGQGLMRANPWERRDRYVENSPFFYLDRVETPVLLLHGVLDDAVPVYASDETFTALRSMGKEVTYAKYAGTDHMIHSAALTVRRDFYSRIVAWFGEYLGSPANSSHER
jgi:dipeptidyl aminopeptidase/acylaminoacyl peptidase